MVSPGAGGGSGGGVLLHGGSVSILGSVTADGEPGGPERSIGRIFSGAGGEGSGGQIVVESFFPATIADAAPSVAGYQPGVISTLLVPEPASLVPLSLGLAAVAGLAWRRRRAA